MRLWLALIVALCLTPALALAELDDAGNIIYDPGQNPVEPGDAPGDPCGQCQTPGTGQKGVTFKGGDLWTIDSAGLLSHYVNCVIVEQQGTQTGASTFGLGYDSNRNLWVITSPSHRSRLPGRYGRGARQLLAHAGIGTGGRRLRPEP